MKNKELDTSNALTNY